MTTDERGHTGRLLPGRKADLVDLVSYGESSVVSRTIISSKAGTVTLFAFDQGSELSEHTAPYDALLHVLEGKAEVTVEGEASSLGHGEAIILPAGKSHAIRALSRFKMLLTMVRTG